MLYLNLLPTKFSQEAKLQNLFQIIFRFGSIWLFFIVLIALSFFIANQIMKNFYDIVNNTNFLMQTQIENPIEVREVNLIVREAEAIQANSFPVLEILEKTSQVLPREVYLELLDLDKEQASITIEGMALTRQALLDLQANLEEAASFSILEFPMENILKKEDIRFKIKFAIKPDQFN